MKEKMIPMLPPVVNYGVASSLSWAKSICNSPEMGITRIRGTPKDHCLFSKVNTTNNADKPA